MESLSGQSGRQTLGELMLIAERTRTTIVAAHHFNKTGRTIDVAIGGGRGVKGIARSILVWGPEPASPIGVADDVDGDDDDEERFLLAHHKSSYGPLAPTLVFRRVQRRNPAGGRVPLFERVDRSELTASELYKGDVCAAQSGRGRKRERAKELILRFLSGAPRIAEDLCADVTSDDITERTFERARTELAEEGVIERFQSGGRHWWRIAVPDQPPA